VIDAPADSFVFVVDTDEYAGNFERELVAFVTGQSGECGVGQEIAVSADLPPDLRDWCEEHVLHLADENGCARPASLWETSGWFNDGLGNHHRDGTDPAIVLATYQKAVENYASNTIEKCYADRTYAKQEADRFRREHMTPGHFPAYLSVAFVLDEKPPHDQFQALVGRAQHYCTTRDIPFTGCRLLQTFREYRDVTP
jgi:hypothetical protein